MRRALAAVLCAAWCVSAACTADTGGTPSTTSAPATTAAAPATTSAASSSAPTTESASTAPPPSTSATRSSRPATSPAERALAKMSLAQRVGQLLMVDCPSGAVASATTTAIREFHVGSVILDGNSLLGVTATRQVSRQLQGLAPRAARLFISTDQEGGLVQRMRGPGFSPIPSAVEQGRKAPVALRASWTTWGGQLHSAGINVDLAPVLDTVPAGSRSNPPIGDLDREYGHTPRAVRRHGMAAVRGLSDARVDATVKHFPGLGRVTGNTDTTAGVTDTVTTRHDAYLAPFAAAVRAHVPFVMVSTAIYRKIDPGTPAAFSPTVVQGMLRHDLGYTGVIITDDVGAAKQVAAYSVGDRAVRFVAAGGDIVLTVDAGQAGPMTAALLARAHHSASFRRKVNAAALRVLQAKQARGLLG